MVQKDNIFRKRLLETFKLEAAEHIKNLTSGLVDLEKTVEADKRAATIENVFREAHSLKGSARVMNISEIESICQMLESVFAALREGKLNLSPEIFDGLHASVDNLGKLLAELDLKDGPQKHLLVDNTVQLLGNILKGSPGPPVQPAEKKPVAKERNIPAEPGVGLLAPGTVRISVSTLESLMMQTEELLSSKQSASQLSRDLEDVSSRMAAWQREWQKLSGPVAQIKSRIEKERSPKTPGNEPQAERLLEFLNWNYEYFKSLENRVAALARTSKSEGDSLGNMVDTLTRDMKKVMMSPFSSCIETFPKFVRDFSREQGKEIELVIKGEEIEIDRRVLEEIKEPLTHMIRNCIDHGIELPEARKNKGKQPRGTITIAVSQKGSSNIEILVADDGNGIDISGVRQSAVKSAILREEDAGKLNENEALSLIFRSGVTTSPYVTGISGRGLGLAIVREKVEKLRGSISVESHHDRGTYFRIVVPLTLAEFRGLVVRAGEHTLVIPAVNVKRVIRVKREDVGTLEGRAAIIFDGQPVSLTGLTDTLEIYPQKETGTSPYLQVMLLSLGGIILAFSVDEVIGEQEVLVKGLGKQLARVKNISGASILNTGRVVPVVNVADLMKSAIKAEAVPVKATAQDEPIAQQSILVVEDSITSRTLLKNILETVGYRVRTAVDGLDALVQLKSESFDLVVSDVDMPRLNGFDLTARIRGDKRLASLPVILVTALESREHRERGIDVGASAYIVKSSFDQGDLLEAIKRMI